MLKKLFFLISFITLSLPVFAQDDYVDESIPYEKPKEVKVEEVDPAILKQQEREALLKKFEEEAREEARKAVKTSETSKTEGTAPVGTTPPIILIKQEKSNANRFNVNGKQTNAEEEEISPTLIAVVIIVLLAGLGLLAYAIKKKACGDCDSCEKPSCESKKEEKANKKTQRTPAPKKQPEPVVSKTPTVERERPKTLNGSGMQNTADETKIDSKGRNPSGIIIDEDAYFSGGSDNFVDEDFDENS